MNLCNYCGNEAKYKLKSGKWCCQDTYQKCPELRRKNVEGLKRKHKEVKDSGKVWNTRGKNGQMWNKGLTKETSPSILKASLTYKEGIKSGRIIPSQFGKPIKDDIKLKISESMKKAHKENRAHNIGSSRWNNQPSYPEQFFMKVIENEFNDKNYIREYSFSIYSLDFAWTEKRKCIEIDGEQHERFEEYKQRDLKKDTYLSNAGWKILRIKWKDLYHNTKAWIKIAKDFIEN